MGIYWFEVGEMEIPKEDLEKAIYWWEKAAAKGNEKAAKALEYVKELQEKSNLQNDEERETEIESLISIETMFINWVKAGKEELSKHIDYPLYREYPIPPIRNREEFLRRYDEIFDTTLLKMIFDTNTAIIWTENWRRYIIVFDRDNGWRDEYEDKVTAINYQSKAETNKKETLIKSYRNSVHESLKNFEIPIAEMETKSYKIRIDDMGNNNYRYASWKVGKSIKEKPDLILTNGTLINDGTEGYFIYSFTNGNYIYQCFFGKVYRSYFFDCFGSNLIVYKNAQFDDYGHVYEGTVILDQKAI